MGSKHQVIRTLLTDAIIDLCRREAFYVEELRIEGTLCIVSDRSSVLITQITEQIGEKITEGDRSLPLLDYDRESSNAEGGSTGKVKEGGENGLKEGLVGNYLEQKEKEKEQHRRDLMELMPSERTDGKYKCPFCPKVYGFKHNLKDHINKHTGRKPHGCKYCGMNFTFLASLCGHIKRRHFHCMPREHQCQICCNRFPNKQSLRQHFTWRHSPQRVKGGQSGKPGLLIPSVPYQQSVLQAASPRQRKNSSPRQKDPTVTSDVKVDIEGEPILEDTAEKCHDEGHSEPQVALPNLIKEEVMCEDEGSRDELRHDADMEEMDLSQALGLSHPGQSTEPQPPVALLGMPLPLLQASSMGFPMFPPPPLFSMPTTSIAPPLPAPYSMSTTSIAPPSPSPKIIENPNQIVPELFRSPDGKFNCPYCEKSYRFKHTLKDHINTHFGKRPHVCKYCNDAFTHFASLCAHIKRRHKEHIPKDFACAICNDNFMNLQSLKQHFTWRHKDVKLPPDVPMFFGPGTGRKLNSGPENPTRSSPISTSSTTISDGQSPNRHITSPGHPLTSPGHPLTSPGHPLASPGHPLASPGHPLAPPGHPLASPGHPLTSPGHPLASPGHPLASPGLHLPSSSQLQSPNNLLQSPGSPALPSMDAFMKGGGFLLPGVPHNIFPEPVKDMMGVMNLEAHQGALFNPMGLLSPQGPVAPPGSNRENFNKNEFLTDY